MVAAGSINLMTTRPDHPEADRKRPWPLLLAVAAAASLCLGLLAGYFLFGADDSDAAAACQGIAKMDGHYEQVTAAGYEGPAVHRLTAIGFSTLAAAADDKEYDALGEAGMDLIGAVQRVDSEQGDAALDDLRAECGDLGY